MPKERIQYFDTIEAISIFLVVFCHYPVLFTAVSGNIIMLICYIAVPLFFMVNGALLFEPKFNKKAHAKRIMHIICTVVIWKVITLTPFALLKIVDLTAYSKAEYFQYFLGGSLSSVPTGHMWFMYELIFCYLLFPILKSCYDSEAGRKNIFYLCVLCFFFFQLVTEANFILQCIHEWTGLALTDVSILRNQYSPISKYGYLLVFFLLGPLMHRYFYIENKKLPRQDICAILSFVVGLIMVFMQKYIQSKSFLWVGEYFANGYSHVGTFLMSVGVFVLLSTKTLKLKAFAKVCYVVSTRTIDIYYIHMILASLLNRYFFTVYPMKGVLSIQLEPVSSLRHP